jgi:hypothetical protein
MDSNQIFNYLAREINKLRDDNAMFISSGRATSFDEYRHAENIIEDLVQKMEKADD